MPTLSNILSHLADALRDNGAQYTVRALDIMSAASTFLLSAGNAMDDDVAAASFLASQLRSEDAIKAADTLGISSDLIPRLTPTLIGIDYQLAKVLARGTPDQALVAATVLFSRYAISAKGGDASSTTSLRRATEAATVEGSRNPELVQKILVEMEKVPLSTPVPLVSSDYMFSISIDLVASTDAKTRIMKVAQGDPRKIDKLNESIYREFCNIERKFYQSVVNDYAPAPPIDPAKFFTVKGIGDEIWILCEATAEDLSQLGHRLIDAAIDVAHQSVRFLATENEDGPSFDSKFDYGEMQPVLSPVKMFIDLVSHASNLSRVRDEALVKEIPDLLKIYHGRKPSPIEIVTTARRMSLSGYEPVGWVNFHEVRSDYIGHEIDRFFRTTKSAIPGTVTIGSSMARAMGLRFKPVAQTIHAVFKDDGTPLTGGTPIDPVHARIRTLKQDELKGIGYAYDTYTLFAPRTLHGLYIQMRADEKNEFPVMPYHETAAQIPPEVVEDLVKEIVKKQKE